MGGSRKPGPVNPSQTSAPPASTPGTWGLNDHGDPNVCTLAGDTPGAVGINDYAAPPNFYYDATYDVEKGICYGTLPAPSDDDWQPVVSGVLLVGTGAGSMVRIPVPGSDGLFIEFSPRGHVPASGSTSTLFIQNTKGNRHLRLDFGYNRNAGLVDFHWNQKGTHANFGITDHTSTGSGGKALYKGAKYFKYAGRTLLVLGAAIDIYSIVVAKNRVKQVAKVVGGWAGAAGGCKLVGAGGAGIGSFAPGPGTAIGGVAGCIVGGIGGYLFGSYVAGEAYDLVEETFFEPVPEIPAIEFP
jgi:hypothetical protein